MIRILLIDGNWQQARATAQLLRTRMRNRLRIAIVHDAEASLGYFAEHGSPDCVLLNLPLVGDASLDLLSRLLAHDPFLAVVITSAGGDDTIGVEAMKRGAMDYCPRRTLTAAALERIVMNAVERAALKRRIEDQQDSLRTFANVLVHDLRGPLRSIRGGVSMLVEDLPKQVSEEHAEVLGFIRDGAERMDQLIVALYRFCSLEDRALATQPVDLLHIVGDLRAMLRADLREKGAELTSDADLPVIHGDPMQLMQLLQNLVANGIKYNMTAAPRVHIAAQETADSVRIEVSDNGIGIEPQYLEEVFQPFRRLHSAEEYSGSGLGLATCRRIAERHGGRIGCRSTPGEGTVFTVELPVSAKPRAVLGGASPHLGRWAAADASR